MDENNPTENPYRNLPIIMNVKSRCIVMDMPIIPIIAAKKIDFLLPIFIRMPPHTAPIVIPKTTELPINA